MRRFILLIIFLITRFALQAQDVRFPSIPASIIESRERTLYLAEHFWEHNDMGDTLLIHHPTVVFDYVYLLSKLPFNEGRRLMSETANKAVGYPDTYSYTEYWFEHYLHDSLSPFYNDELFIPFLEGVVDSKIDETKKMRARFLLSRCLMNRVGDKANDFVICSADGENQSLSQISADTLLLWFYQEGCRACSESADYLKNSATAHRAFEKYNITLISIDVKQYPNLAGNLYELQYYPVFYLLDKNRHIILKEATLDKIDSFFKSIN